MQLENGAQLPSLLPVESLTLTRIFLQFKVYHFVALVLFIGVPVWSIIDNQQSRSTRYWACVVSLPEFRLDEHSVLYRTKNRNTCLKSIDHNGDVRVCRALRSSMPSSMVPMAFSTCVLEHCLTLELKSFFENSLLFIHAAPTGSMYSLIIYKAIRRRNKLAIPKQSSVFVYSILRHSIHSI